MCRAVELLGAVPAVAPESSSQDVILRRPQAGPRRTTSPTDGRLVWGLEVTLGPGSFGPLDTDIHCLTGEAEREEGTRPRCLIKWLLEVM